MSRIITLEIHIDTPEAAKAVELILAGATRIHSVPKKMSLKEVGEYSGLSGKSIRDSELKGFALRVFPSGTVKYIVEVWYSGRSHRKTLGTCPVLSLKDARQGALSFIRGVQLGQLDEKPKVKQVTLGKLFDDYIKGDRLDLNVCSGCTDQSPASMIYPPGYTLMRPLSVSLLSQPKAVMVSFHFSGSDQLGNCSSSGCTDKLSLKD